MRYLKATELVLVRWTLWRRIIVPSADMRRLRNKCEQIVVSVLAPLDEVCLIAHERFMYFAMDPVRPLLINVDLTESTLMNDSLITERILV